MQINIIGSLIKKIKQLVQAYKDWRFCRQTVKWVSSLTDEELKQYYSPVTDEELRQEAEQAEEWYRQECKEEDERMARQQKELADEILDEKRLERQMEEWSMQDEWQKRFDNEKFEGNDIE